jgi:hypothetical protein
MLFLLNKTRYGALARAAVGIAILVLGIVGHAKIALVLGAILIVWALFSGVAAWRARDEDGKE